MVLYSRHRSSGVKRMTYHKNIIRTVFSLTYVHMMWLEKSESANQLCLNGTTCEHIQDQSVGDIQGFAYFNVVLMNVVIYHYHSSDRWSLQGTGKYTCRCHLRTSHRSCMEGTCIGWEELKERATIQCIYNIFYHHNYWSTAFVHQSTGRLQSIGK